MKELNEKVVELLNSTELWWIGTNGEEPNVVPVGFKEIAEDGKLIVGVLHLNTTLANLEKDNRIAVSVCSGKTMVGYQIKGTAKFVAEGKYADKWKEVSSKMFNGKMSTRGVLEITPEKVINTTPGPKNNTEL